MNGLLQDGRYAVRGLKRTPGFTIVAILTLALGIGANSAMFSLAYNTLVRPLPFDAAHELVTIGETPPKQTGRSRVAFLNFVDWREQSHTFESMAAVTGSAVTILGPDGTPEQIRSQSVTVDFFRVFRVRPLLGRQFTDADVIPKPNVVAVGEAFWRTRLNADPAALGRTITLNSQPYTVIAVIPASFQVLDSSELWTLFSAPAGAPFLRRARFFDVVGRLKAGVTLDAARAELATVAGNIAIASPETNKGWTATVDPMTDAVVNSELKRTSQLLLAVVLCVLLIATANVASLVTARGVGRTREFAVRAALGAGRRRVLQQSVTENVVLASFGGVVGLALCSALLRAAPAMIPPGLLPPSVTLSVDWRVTMFCALITLAVGVLCGLSPVWQATRVSLTAAMGAGTRGATAKTGAVRTALTIIEIAAAVLLLCGAGLLVRTLHRLTNVDAGYRANAVITARVTLPTTRYNTQERMLSFYENVQREVDALPGLRAAIGTSLPLDGSFFGQPFEIVGDPPVEASRRPIAYYEMISDNYLDLMGIPIVQGRGFTDRDRGNAAAVCLVSEEFVRRFLTGRNPIGMQIRVSPMSLDKVSVATREIVGVVKQVRQRPGEPRPAPQLYVPTAQNAWFAGSLVVQTAAREPGAIIPTVKAAVAKVDPALPLTRVRTLEDISSEANGRPRFRAQLIGAFAMLALLLAIVGLFGMLAFSVQQRMQEFGIRLAVGANARDIVRLVLASTLRLTLSGIVLGLAAAAALSRFMEGLLFGVQPVDVATFSIVAGLLMVTALAAALAPLRRAARVNPLVTLRYE